MPFRCLDAEGHGLVSLDLSMDAWDALKLQNRQKRHLRFPCCSADVVLKTSSRGLQYFAHKARGACNTAPESEAHLHLKALALGAARAAGWSAAVEVSGQTPAGEEWRADVLAKRGKARVAIEIQWSTQTPEETLRRQQRYQAAGIRGLWLLRQGRFPISRDLPAARIAGSLREGFSVDLKTITSGQRLGVQEFLAAAFSGRLRYGVPEGINASILIYAGTMDCWRNRICGKRTRVVTRIELHFGPNSWDFDLDQLSEHDELSRRVLAEIPRLPDLGEIKPRYSNTQERNYLSNGCHACGGLMGGFYLHNAMMDEEVIASFEVPFAGAWRRAVSKALDREKVPMAWGVYKG